MLIETVIARIEAAVPVLVGRTKAAADLSALMASNALPSASIGAHVLPLGLQGGRAEAAAGAFTQSLDEVVGVVLTFRAAGRTGEDAIEKVRDIIQAVLGAICGWGPDDMPGVFRVLRGAMLTFSGGTLVYQLDFAINDQLRIYPS